MTSAANQTGPTSPNGASGGSGLTGASGGSGLTGASGGSGPTGASGANGAINKDSSGNISTNARGDSTTTAAARNLAAELRLTPEQLAEKTQYRHAKQPEQPEEHEQLERRERHEQLERRERPEQPDLAGLAQPSDFTKLTMMQRMMSGQLYRADDPDIHHASLRGKSAAQAINRLDFADTRTRNQQLSDLLGTFGDNSTIIPEITVDYGFNIHIGDHTFVNFHSVFLDVCPITIGNHCQIGPRAQFLTPLHPIENFELRAAEWEYGAPITLEDNVWLAGGVTVCAGVTIGANTVVGAGSVVTKDLPSGVLAAGTPARVIRSL